MGQDRKRSKRKEWDRGRELEWNRVVSAELSDEGKRPFHTEECKEHQSPVIEHTQDDRPGGSAFGTHLNALKASHSPDNCLGYERCHTGALQERGKGIKCEIRKDVSDDET